MSTTTTNMDLTIPAVGSTPGPDYAQEVNDNFNIIDSHNHAPGYGVPINPDGIYINADLAMNSNNLTTAKTVRFASQNSTIANSSPNIGCIYVSGNELYYNDYSGGHIVQITNNGAISGGSSSIISFAPANNQAVAANVTGALFSTTLVRSFILEYSVFRKTDSNEASEVGVLAGMYSTSGTSWTLSNQSTAGPSGNAGMTFSITSGGQIQYTSSNLSGANYVGSMKFLFRSFNQ